MAVDTSVDDLIALYERWGDVHYDDLVTQTDHALQCAALAVQSGAPEPLVASALLHDVGHLLELDRSDGRMGNLGVDRDHEAIGGRWLAQVFPASVTGPVALHVAAKRYLCAVEPAYQESLSDGSIRSLVVQGGLMNAVEVSRFASLPGADSALSLRRWDDAAKVVGLVVQPFEHYRRLLARCRYQRGNTASAEHDVVDMVGGPDGSGRTFALVVDVDGPLG